MNFEHVFCAKCLIWDYVTTKICRRCGDGDIVIIPEHIPERQKSKWVKLFLKGRR